MDEVLDEKDRAQSGAVETARKEALLERIELEQKLEMALSAKDELQGY